VYVACSTLCFGKQPLGEALRAIGEMGFTKVDVAVTEGGPHLSPSEVAADPSKAAQILKTWPGISTAAFHVEFAHEISVADADQQLRAICRLARVLAVSMVSIPPGAVDCDFEKEVQRLTRLVHTSDKEGVTLAVETRMGTLTETPSKTLELCKRVPGLGVALDPSHYVAGPFHSQEFDELYPYVKHVRLRDTGKNIDKFQVRVGQGEIEYGRIVNQLTRCHYKRSLGVDIRDQPELDFPMQPEVRKLKYLLESLI
jgi:sugar phosphate isomerase/epimerase